MTILELALQTGIQPKWAAGTAGGEYHSACPICGGTDRFYLQPYRQMSNCQGSYCCRQCGIYGDAIQFARQFLNYSFQEAVQAVNAIIPDKAYQPIFKSSHVFGPVVLQQPPSTWIARATEFVNQAHENLLHQEEVLTYLANRGLPLNAVLRYKLGWSNRDEFLLRSDWGLDEQINQDSKQRTLWIPEGLVIPFIESSGKVVRIKARRFGWKEEDKLPKYIAISGSMNGMSIIGSSKQKIVAVVESELDAYAIDHELQNFVCTVAVGSNIKNPDNLTDRLAKNAKCLFICHDNDEAGKKMLIKWQKLYSHAKPYPTPIGKDIGEAIQQNFNIREWLQEFLPDDYKKSFSTSP
jgi:DNA primase